MGVLIDEAAESLPPSASLVNDNAQAMMAAVRSGQAPFEVLRDQVDRLLARMPDSSNEWLKELLSCIRKWAQDRRLALVRAEPLTWAGEPFDGELETYLLPAELDLSMHVEAGHSVILATTEEPRRFARHMLRQTVGSRPVYLWTVASGLFKVDGNAEQLSFKRPGDPNSVALEGGSRFLSTLCQAEDVDPHEMRIALVAHRGYSRCGIGIDDDRRITGFVLHEEIDNGLRVELVVDDLDDDSVPISPFELEQAHLVVSQAKREALTARLAWPPRSESLFGGGEKPPPFLGEIQYIMSVQQPGALFVMLDANLFLESRGPDSPSIAATFLKDASARLRRAATGTQILVLSTPLAATRALTDELACVELPLPSRNELIVELRRLLAKHRIGLAQNAGIDAFKVSDELSMLSDAAAGMTFQDIGAAVRRSCAEGPATISSILAALQVGKRAAVKRSPALELVDSMPLRHVSLGGVDRLLGWLRVRRRVFEHPEKAARFGIERRPKGVLLLGIPGTGKSLAAKIIAREWNLPLVRLDMGAIQNMYVGASEQRIREALKIVEAMSPCVLWIDEIDKGVAQGDGTASHSTDLNIRATLLTWLQESRAPVFCVATANRFTNLPPELTRAGRFDARFFLGCPNLRGRRQILDIHLAVRGIVMDDEGCNEAVKAMHGFTGAEIEQSVLDGLYGAFAAERALVPTDISQAATRIKPIVRAVGEGLDELWMLVDEGRVELASDEFLTRSDLAKLIDPTLFSPMYCRLHAIAGWEKHAVRAERLLMVDPVGARAAAILETGDPDWIYVQLNVRYAEEDQHAFKFLDRVETVCQNGILDLLVPDLGIEVLHIESEELAERLKKQSWIGGYAEIFRVTPRTEP